MPDHSTRSADTDLSAIPDIRMRELARLMRHMVGQLSQERLREEANLQASVATINRWKRAIEPRYLQDPVKWSDDQQAALSFLSAFFEERPATVAEPALTGDLTLESSDIFEGFARSLDISPRRMDILAESFPGDYLMIAFSSSWPRSFTVSVVRVGVKGLKKRGKETVFTEVQINKSTNNKETYKGLVYGHSDMWGMIGFSPSQGFVRHYVAKERSPRVGKMIWLQGFLVTSTGDNGGFSSPFFMERIPDGPFREQHCYDDEERSRRREGAAGFLLHHFCDVAPFEQIVESYRALESSTARHASTIEVMPGPRALTFLREFIQHAELHFHQAHEQTRYSYERLKPAQDEHWMSRLLKKPTRPDEARPVASPARPLDPPGDRGREP
jgi:hypothetical protein